MIPAFDESGNLPPGVHSASWAEISVRFGTTARRRWLLDGLREALVALRDAGCPRAYIDGSFVTVKAKPDDFDGCWEARGVDAARLDPVLLDFDNLRAAQKARFRGELFPGTAGADEKGTLFIDFFQRDRHTDAPKGIIAIDLTGFP